MTKIGNIFSSSGRYSDFEAKVANEGSNLQVSSLYTCSSLSSASYVSDNCTTMLQCDSNVHEAGCGFSSSISGTSKSESGSVSEEIQGNLPDNEITALLVPLKNYPPNYGSFNLSCNSGGNDALLDIDQDANSEGFSPYADSADCKGKSLIIVSDLILGCTALGTLIMAPICLGLLSTDVEPLQKLCQSAAF
ncbi:hypothetical protein [Candidatus Ichthyocystis hellenicum]|uniref:hypothetical protein n=1 Tax=Candidatus Ichthyocystis hellenicum TaxID=1561003 RepID=UPI000B8815D7|nr:hypothetical protein [Candidatus Ichthyocystis hellenicum]